MLCLQSDIVDNHSQLLSIIMIPLEDSPESFNSNRNWFNQLSRHQIVQTFSLKYLFGYFGCRRLELYYIISYNTILYSV